MHQPAQPTPCRPQPETRHQTPPQRPRHRLLCTPHCARCVAKPTNARPRPAAALTARAGAPASASALNCWRRWRRSSSRPPASAASVPRPSQRQGCTAQDTGPLQQPQRLLDLVRARAVQQHARDLGLDPDGAHAASAAPPAGKTNSARRPPPWRLLKLTLPPCWRTIWRTIASPRPTPPVSRLREPSTR